MKGEQGLSCLQAVWPGFRAGEMEEKRRGLGLEERVPKESWGGNRKVGRRGERLGPPGK